MLISTGQPDSALALARRAVMGDTANVDFLLALADAQKAKAQMMARRETLERVIETQPRSIEARVKIAEDFFEAQQLDSAAHYAYSALTKSNRRSADAYYWLGRIHQQAGHPDSALFYYRGAWVLLPDGDLF
jgi:tetratricopeptide (TPR) repeat protein